MAVHCLQESLKRKLNARIEYAKFLQDTAQEMAKEVQKSRSGDIKQTAKNLDEFLNKVNNEFSNTSCFPHHQSNDVKVFLASTLYI